MPEIPVATADTWNTGDRQEIVVNRMHNPHSDSSLQRRAIYRSDILDVPADALIYSTNVLLNCTGGVGGALLQRYGGHVQTELHRLLSGRGGRFAHQGEIFDCVPAGLPYRHLIHTIPSDGLYNTTEVIVEDILRRALATCASDVSVRRVVVSALATGYGQLPFDAFVPIAARVFNEAALASTPEIILCLGDDASFSWAKQLIAELDLGLEEAE